GLRGPLERHRLDHGGNIVQGAEPESRVAGLRRPRQGAVHTKLLEQHLERRQLDGLIGCAERDHHATAPQASESGGDRLAVKSLPKVTPRRGEYISLIL